MRPGGVGRPRPWPRPARYGRPRLPALGVSLRRAKAIAAGPLPSCQGNASAFFPDASALP